MLGEQHAAEIVRVVTAASVVTIPALPACAFSPEVGLLLVWPEHHDHVAAVELG